MAGSTGEQGPTGATGPAGTAPTAFLATGQTIITTVVGGPGQTAALPFSGVESQTDPSKVTEVIPTDITLSTLRGQATVQMPIFVTVSTVRVTATVYSGPAGTTPTATPFFCTAFPLLIGDVPAGTTLSFQCTGAALTIAAGSNVYTKISAVAGGAPTNNTLNLQTAISLAGS